MHEVTSEGWQVTWPTVGGSRRTVARKFQRLVNRGLLRIEEKGQYKAKVTF